MKIGTPQILAWGPQGLNPALTTKWSKIVLKPVNEIIFIRQIKVWIKHTILFVDIIYSMRDLYFDLNNYA